ncbi:MAG: hypothetical protein QOF14_5077 [Hyphomicrobiales bacterium]|nr:hypothetical protein [Hyphomicrobiales bacterium]
MAGVYFTVWLVRPDYFRVQQDVNFLPLDLIQMAREQDVFSGAQPINELLIPDETKVVANLRSTLDTINALSTTISSKRESVAALSKAIADGEAAFVGSQMVQFEEYVKQAIASFENGVAAKSEEMKNFVQSFGVSTPEQLSSEAAVRYSRLAIERAQLNVDLANARAEAYRIGLQDLRQFQNTPEQQAHIALIEQLRDDQRELLSLQNKRINLNGTLYQLLVDYRRLTHAKLNFVDFVYFSVGAATTATFGDISPNHWSIRLLVSMQVLLSILLVGRVVNDLNTAGRRV